MASVPPGVYVYRLKDAGGWGKSAETRFTPSNDYDFMLFAPRSTQTSGYNLGLFCALELKSVKEKRWPYKSLRPQQRKGLLRAGKFGCPAGILLNFRAEDRTFFIDILALVQHEQASSAKSLSVADAARIAAHELDVRRAITRQRFGVNTFVNSFMGG